MVLSATCGATVLRSCAGTSSIKKKVGVLSWKGASIDLNHLLPVYDFAQHTAMALEEAPVDHHRLLSPIDH
jgi:hypothetical protein